MPTDALATWQPESGETTQQLLEGQRLPDEAKLALIRHSARSLGRCANPQTNGSHSEAHLVVGQVQSGKTLAFTTLMALARDNGYRLIVVVAGTKRNLFAQTVGRLKEDLFTARRGLSPWRVYEDHKAANDIEIADIVRDPHDPSAGTQTVVCFVLKNATSLKGLAAVLSDVAKKVDLSSVPALVIDDEADQASPNLKARSGEQSGVYAALSDLRASLPRHDLLLYTATPEAPLLIGRRDELSPKTVTVLESGREYTGGIDLFFDSRDSYVRLIPETELASALDPDGGEPPASLKRAIATFLLGVIIAQRDQTGRHPWPLAMLIHPAHTRDLHDTYARWSRAIRDDLRTRLADVEDVAFRDLVENELRVAYDDLAGTLTEPPPLAELARDIPRYARQIEIRVVNQSDPREIGRADWQQHPGWIVIGGNKLDRGFTVMNLTTTYMPRGTGVGNADTLQQRGRFYGYKRSYLDLCRGWFNAETANAFAEYVHHEAALHRALTELDSAGEPLSEWRRHFLLSRDLQPTRKQVINRNVKRFALTGDNGWFWQRHVFEPTTIGANRDLASWVISSYRERAQLDPHDPRGKHSSVRVPMTEMQRILIDWATTGDDADRMLGLQLALGEWSVTDGTDALLVFMESISSVDDADAMRVRRPREDVALPSTEASVNLVQGQDGRTGYPGDGEVKDGEVLTVQLHLLALTDRDGRSWYSGAPALGIHTPTRLADLILEVQS